MQLANLVILQPEAKYLYHAPPAVRRLHYLAFA